MKSFTALIICGVLLCSQVAGANEHPSFHTPTHFGPLNAAEAHFVTVIQADLGSRFATAADAERAGFVRYTNEDSTGAISYADRRWESADLKHPSQLWYDKNGDLLGADFSRLKTGNMPPKLWGIHPGRWWEFDRHMHYVIKDPVTGKPRYDSYLADDDWLNAGGNLKHPEAQTLVALKVVKSPIDVVTVFNFPAVWDLIVWVKPNPKGAFAEKNPLVKP